MNKRERAKLKQRLLELLHRASKELELVGLDYEKGYITETGLKQRLRAALDVGHDAEGLLNGEERERQLPLRD